MDFGRTSNPAMTVAPVVVRPDKDSNTASVIDSSIEGEMIKGKDPAVPNTVQNSVTIRKLSLVLSSFFDRAVNIHSRKPAMNIETKETAKAVELPSL